MNNSMVTTHGIITTLQAIGGQMEAAHFIYLTGRRNGTIWGIKAKDATSITRGFDKSASRA